MSLSLSLLFAASEIYHAASPCQCRTCPTFGFKMGHQNEKYEVQKLRYVRNHLMQHTDEHDCVMIKNDNDT